MAEVTADRVYETSATTGTGSYTLAGAISGYRAFSAVCANGDTVRCFVEEVDGNGVPNGGWEVGIYTWGTGGTLARTTIEASSNGNAAVSWSAGTRRIGLGVTASKLAVVGLSFFSNSTNTSSPNTTVPVVALNPVNAATNVDLALVPKGAGALTAQIADGTNTGGNKRGTRAVDFQALRTAATQVASGASSAIAGGASNTASGPYSSVGGGQTNTASGDYSAVSGGAGNTAAASYSYVAGGNGNAVSGSSAANAAIVGGTNNTATGNGSFIAGSTRAIDRGYQFGIAHSAGRFSTDGDAQSMRFVQRRTTTDATPTILTGDGNLPFVGLTAIAMPNSSAYSFKALVVGRANATGDCTSFEVKGTIKRGASAAATAIVGAVTATALGADAGASSWVVTAIADTSMGGLAIQVTGAAATNIKWVASIWTTEAVG